LVENKDVVRTIRKCEDTKCARKHGVRNSVRSTAKIKTRVIDSMLLANFRGNKFKTSYKTDDRYAFNANTRGSTFE
jgi:hypothetical protein